MRGDRPFFGYYLFHCLTFTPHARGSTLLWLLSFSLFDVYPACAGIDPYTVRRSQPRKSLPRMRGDRPENEFPQVLGVVFTPHARGSTVGNDYTDRLRTVYPACAGIDRRLPHYRRLSPRLPRMRGDRPNKNCKKRLQPQFTPHARGSTAKRR